MYCSCSYYTLWWAGLVDFENFRAQVHSAFIILTDCTTLLQPIHLQSAYLLSFMWVYFNLRYRDSLPFMFYLCSVLMFVQYTCIKESFYIDDQMNVLPINPIILFKLRFMRHVSLFWLFYTSSCHTTLYSIRLSATYRTYFHFCLKRSIIILKMLWYKCSKTAACIALE